MKRSERLLGVRRAMENEQRTVANRVDEKRRGVEAATSKLQELLQYREDYLVRYRHEASRGLASSRVRNYQAFLARLDLALRQQHELLARAKAEAEFESAKLHDISGQIMAVSGVAARWSQDERQLETRLEQNREDERGARVFLERANGENA